MKEKVLSDWNSQICHMPSHVQRQHISNNVLYLRNHNDYKTGKGIERVC